MDFNKAGLFTYLISMLIDPYILMQSNPTGNDQATLNILILAWSCEVKYKRESHFGVCYIPPGCINQHFGL